MELKEKLNQIFCEVFDDDNIKISPEMTYYDIDGWDSLSHVNLIQVIELTFNIKLTEIERIESRTVDNIYKLINSKLHDNEDAIK